VCRQESARAKRARGYQSHWLVALVPVAAEPTRHRLQAETASVDSTLAMLPLRTTSRQRTGGCACWWPAVAA
jgi:hypothetical protein